MDKETLDSIDTSIADSIKPKLGYVGNVAQVHGTLLVLSEFDLNEIVDIWRYYCELDKKRIDHRNDCGVDGK